MNHIKLSAQAAMEGGLTAWMESEEMGAVLDCFDAVAKRACDPDLTSDIKSVIEGSYKQGFINGAMHGCNATIAECKAGMEGA